MNLVAHDLDAGVGFQYAAQYPAEVARYAHLDYGLPGPALSAAQLRSFSWHIAFHQQERVPEAVVADNVHDYLALFYPQVAYGGSSYGGTRTASPITVPTMLMKSQGTLATYRGQVEPRMANIVRAVEVPHAGHWLAEENPAFVTTELLGFLAG